MDFRTAQPIIDACRKKAEEGIWGYTSRPASYFEAVREWEEKRNQWNPDTRLMSWAIGVVPAMASLIKLLQKKETVFCSRRLFIPSSMILRNIRDEL